MSYTMKITVDGDFDEVLEATESTLADEGFGILSDIDMGSTFEEKLDVDFRQYRILGACNPPLAHEAAGEEIDIGALLPCNVAVYEGEESDVVVTAADPETLLDITGNEALDDIAAEVRERLERVLEAVPQRVQASQ